MNPASVATSIAKGQQTINETMDLVRGFAENANAATSLPKFTKQSIVAAPCFIQRSIAEESVINDIIKNLYNLYVGYIICALEMDQMIVGGKRVRDIMNTVSTVGAFESINDFIDTESLVGQLAGSMEGYTYQSKRSTDDYGNPKEEITRTYTQDPAKNDYQVDKKMNIPISSGRYINLTMAVGPSGATINIPLMVNINSRIVPSSVMEYVFGRDFNMSLINRFTQYQAGEIRFIKDFVFGIDKLERRAKALKEDKDNNLVEILRQQNKSKFKKIIQDPNKRSYNLANAILIADEQTVKDVTKKAGINLERSFDRQRFFNTIYGLFIVLVDSRYSRVTIYTNGIDQSASYSYNEMKASSASDKLSLKEIMEYLSKNQMPRF